MLRKHVIYQQIPFKSHGDLQQHADFCFFLTDNAVSITDTDRSMLSEENIDVVVRNTRNT